MHSPEAWASIVVRLTNPAALSTAVVCLVAISCCPSGLAHDVEAAREWRVTEAALWSAGSSQRSTRASTSSTRTSRCDRGASRRVVVNTPCGHFDVENDALFGVDRSL